MLRAKIFHKAVVVGAALLAGMMAGASGYAQNATGSGTLDHARQTDRYSVKKLNRQEAVQLCDGSRPSDVIAGCSVLINDLETPRVRLIELLFRRGKAYLVMGASARALVDYNRALLLDRKNYVGFMRRAQIWRQRNNCYRANGDYARVVRLKPDFAPAYKGRGICLYQLKRYGLALKALDEVIRLDPGDKEAHYYRGLCLGARGQFALALKAYNGALRLDPDYVAALLARADTLEKSGEQTQANKDRMRAQTLSPAQ